MTTPSSDGTTPDETAQNSTDSVSAAPVELVRVIRSGFHECSHYGAIVVTDADGTVLHSRGDVTTPVFPRSSNKPFQSLAMLAAGAGLRDADLALASASHSGEAAHTDRVHAMLAAVGLSEADLRCPVALPLNEATRNDVIRAGGSAQRVYMNCSGKHAGMLAACVAAGWDLESYLDPAHPLQKAIFEQVAKMSGETPTATGIDGCGAPLYAISLTGLARAFGRMTSAAVGTPERTVADAMRAYPDMVGGTGRDDTLLMAGIPGLLVKGGAEGVHTAALADGRGVAVKIQDGGDRARMPALVAGLRYLGVTGDVLDQLGTGTILGGGIPVGTVALAPDVF
ncbi:asparaginase [Nakamurella antarctica]|uniref:Asparaginase n=1 Tax=Nakamurella antarctica TaxID=1902245 RepID=A0A3G8ZP67_9ACTN|nr:asparaginase [Nakamurella antarctica]AZI59053.1 asparaginase [Nakamurella antarctica]